MRKSNLICSVIAVAVSAVALSSSKVSSSEAPEATFMAKEVEIAAANSNEPISDEVELLLVEPASVVFEEETPTVLPSASRIEPTLVDEELISVKEWEEEQPEFGSAVRYNPEKHWYESTDGEIWSEEEYDIDLGPAICYDEETKTYRTSDGKSWKEEEVAPLIPAATSDGEEEVPPLIPAAVDGEDVAPLIPPAVNEEEQGITIPPAIYDPAEDATATDATATATDATAE